MSLFLDTGVIVAAVNLRDANHRPASMLLRGAASGRFGEVITSDYVFDEAVTLAFVRTRRADLAIRVGELILGTGAPCRLMWMAYVSPRMFLRAWARFQRLASRGLSFTDCTSLEIIESMAIDEIASFDRDFDGLIARRPGVEDSD